MIRNLVAAIGMGATLLGTAPAGAATATATSNTTHPVVELRQYKLVEGARDAFVDLFDRTFVESQEATGMRLIGQFRDHDRGDRFTWIREFPDMDARGKALNDFYFGPVWQAHRATANPLLDDNDNVLLLRPARNGSGFGPSAARAAPGEPATRSGLVFVTIEYLWAKRSWSGSQRPHRSRTTKRRWPGCTRARVGATRWPPGSRISRNDPHRSCGWIRRRDPR
jgi:hypothetical protein